MADERIITEVKCMNAACPGSTRGLSPWCPACERSNGEYEVKCDDCKVTLRRTDDVRESYAGGRCAKCEVYP